LAAKEVTIHRKSQEASFFRIVSGTLIALASAVFRPAAIGRAALADFIKLRRVILLFISVVLPGWQKKQQRCPTLLVYTVLIL
jgi:hypothetical protein